MNARRDARELALRVSEPVVDHAWHRLGRLHDVYVSDQDGRPVAVGITLRGLGGRRVVVPVERIEELGMPGDPLVLDVTARELRACPTAPAVGYLSEEELQRHLSE